MYTKLVPETVNYVIKMPLGFLVFVAVVWLVFDIFLVTKTFDVNLYFHTQMLKSIQFRGTLSPFVLSL